MPADGGENTVACAAPDAAGLTGGELWLTLTLALGSGVQSGQQTMKVTISNRQRRRQQHRQHHRCPADAGRRG
jgi:hypothetical protein